MTERIASLIRHFTRPMPRRQALLGMGALALGTTGALGSGQAAEAKSCRHKNRRCKKRCDRKHAEGSLGRAGCRAGCGLGCGF